MDKPESKTVHKREQIKAYILMHMILLLFSVSSICSKMAGQSDFLSLHFFFYYGMVLLIMAVYAVLWQQILKRIPIITAYANKAVTIIWGLLWGLLFFSEAITFKKVAGVIVIICGIVMVVRSDDT